MTHPRAPRPGLVPLTQALEDIAGLAHPVAPLARSLGQATGHRLAADIIAPSVMPEHACASMDGWAVEALAVLGASPYAPVPLTTAPVWVGAGESLPPGADTVLPAEAMTMMGVFAEAIADAAPGSGVIAMGADMAAGARLMQAGMRPSATTIAMLALAGITQVMVRAPRLALLPLMPAFPRAGEDPLSDLIANHIVAGGGCVERCAPAPRDLDGLSDAISRAAELADAVIVMGGTGRGHDDRAAPALAASGHLVWHGLALRPGLSAGFGHVGKTPVLLLPGRIAPALAVWLTLGRALLAGLSGAAYPVSQAHQPGTCLPLARKLVSPVGLADLAFFAIHDAEANPLGGDDIPLSAMIRADAFAILLPDSEGLPAGAQIALERLA